MRTKHIIKTFTLIMFLASAASAQHEGHGAGDTSAAKKPAVESKAKDMKMMDKDRKFIEQMIPHHQDAVDMAKLALERSRKDEIRKLSGAIIKAQEAEIILMGKWYKDWYKTALPVAGMKKGKHGSSMGHGMMHMDMENMMKMDLNELKNAPDFDRKYIEMMVKHHAMAVMMSGMIIDSGKGELRKLAREINSSQSAEIEQMIQWYIKWYGGWK